MCITSLSTLLQGVMAVPSVFDVTIHGLKTDSREVASGDAFIALSGTRTPADFYVDAAIKAGATAILLESDRVAECSERHGALVVPVVRGVPVVWAVLGIPGILGTGGHRPRGF